MRNSSQYIPRKVCYPIGSLSCIPEEAEMVINQGEKWGYKQKGDTQYRYLDSVDAPTMGYYVPHFPPNAIVTNNHVYYAQAGVGLIVVGILLLFLSKLLFSAIVQFWGYIYLLSLTEILLICVITCVCGIGILVLMTKFLHKKRVLIQ